jgi:D-amino-acid dehydrogenase
MPKSRALIIGAGIAGISAAYYLNKAGIQVTVIDKESGRNNCSYGNAGMIVPSHIIPLASPGMISKGLRWMLKAESPFYIRPRMNLELFGWAWQFRKSSTEKHVQESGPILRDLLLKSRELLIEIEEKEKLEFHFKKNGLFMFCNTQKGLDSEAEIAEKAQNLGVPAKVLTPAEVKSKEPGFDFNIKGATYFPLDAHLHPGSLMNGLKNILNSRGVSFIYDTKITRFESDSTKITTAISSDGLTWKADYYIICGGAWSAGLAKSAGLRIPLQAGKGYSITLNNLSRLPEYCGIFAEAKVTMTPMYNTLRFGGTMEIAGTDKRINRKKLTGLKKSVCNYLPQFNMTDLETENTWVGLRPCSPDGMPYAGAAKKFDNLYVSTGHAMMGMSLAPASGLLISDLILNGRSELSHHKIDPNRYD